MTTLLFRRYEKLRAPLDSIDTNTQQLFTLSPEPLDQLLGCLLLPEQVSLLHGPERAPLTYLAHVIAIAGAGQSKHSYSVFIDSGANYSPKLSRAMCSRGKECSEVLSRIVVGSVLSLSDLEQLSENIKSMDDVSIIVLDSLTGVLNLSGAPGTVGRQRELFHTLEVLRGVVSDLGAHMLMTDHSSRNWSSGRPTPIGGNVLAHAVDSVVRVDKLDVGKNLIRILIERSTLAFDSDAVILKTGKTGLRKIR
ncbi:MAG: hypothetical protein ACFFD6_11510 [Candidatus Thorarchaeota archaeon]